MVLALVPGKEGSRSLCVDDGGSGAGGVQVLFVHALAGNAAQWHYQLDHLRRKRRAMAFDLAGHGHSVPPEDGDYSVEALARGIETVADAMALERFILVGHSMGATLAIAFAARHPEKVAGLFLADPSGDARRVPRDQMSQLILGLESDSYQRVIEGYWSVLLAGSRREVRERVIRDLRDTPRETVVKSLKQSLDYDPLTPLQSYRGPKLSVTTDLNDAPFSLHNLLPDLPHIQITGTGHWLQMDRPDELNRILDVFLKSADANNS
jgi:pimeloyl-ACP methyl ester carboxylesterase